MRVMGYSILLLMRNRLFTVITQWLSQRNSTEIYKKYTHTDKKREGERCNHSGRNSWRGKLRLNWSGLVKIFTNK